MANFQNSQGRKVVLAQVQTILDNRAYLSEVDGKIGDGDHGINMAKGFTLIRDRLGDKEVSLSDGLGLIGKTLMTEIGGSMGPIYGTFFIQMSLKAKRWFARPGGRQSRRQNSNGRGHPGSGSLPEGRR
jgi:phosphoenolpyruvate---glycerone phosphotransferase subunit DhaL